MKCAIHDIRFLLKWVSSCTSNTGNPLKGLNVSHVSRDVTTGAANLPQQTRTDLAFAVIDNTFIHTVWSLEESSVLVLYTCERGEKEGGNNEYIVKKWKERSGIGLKKLNKEIRWEVRERKMIKKYPISSKLFDMNPFFSFTFHYPVLPKIPNLDVASRKLEKANGHKNIIRTIQLLCARWKRRQKVPI